MIVAWLVCGSCGSSRTAALARFAPCPYCHPSDATPRLVSRRDVTLLPGERERDA